jgi:hypothetical protein
VATRAHAQSYEPEFVHSIMHSEAVNTWRPPMSDAEKKRVQGLLPPKTVRALLCFSAFFMVCRPHGRAPPAARA